ncbi:MAG: dihydrofolate reductase [Beijerinckiaceae bacterium]|jgi:dihydrofolate reductase|nr:dihydrofolate reductase [Beijerinckiaceae bacterium]
MAPEIVLIAAQAKNRVIGDDNQLIWRLKSDLKHFRALTMGHPVILGRKTYDSIGKPLPGRSMIVLTRDPAWQADGVRVAHSEGEALAIAREEAEKLGVKAVFVAGGGEIYRLFLPLAQRLEITEVDLEPAGDATFPPIETALWRVQKEQSFTKSADDEADFRFRSYVRR